MARTIYVSSIYGSDDNNGLTNTYPLKTLNKVNELYGQRLNVVTTVKLACGEVFNENTTAWHPNGPLLRFEPWEREVGDYIRLGKPAISGGTVVTNWTQYSENLWYSDDVALPLYLADAGQGYVPAFPYNYLSRGVLMVSGVVFKRRDGLRNKNAETAVPGQGNLFHTGVFDPDTDTLAADEWANDLSQINTSNGTGVQRTWIGTDPSALFIEVSTRTTPILFNLPLRLELYRIEVRCSGNTIISLGEVEGTTRRVLIEECKVVGSGNNGIALGGGDVIAIKNTSILNCFNCNLILNKGVSSAVLLEDVIIDNYGTHGTLPNGYYYDDRCINDAVTLHGAGGAQLTIRRVTSKNARENALDILDNYTRVLVDRCNFSQAGQNVFTTNSPTDIRRTVFHNSGKGVVFSFHQAASALTEGYPYNINATAAGSTMDQCIIVNCGDSSYGNPSECCGLDVFGADGDEPIKVTRTYIIGSAGATRPLINVRSKRETRPTDGTITQGTWYPPCDLHLTKCFIDHAGSADNRQVELQLRVANNPPDLAESKIVIKDTVFAPGGIYRANGTDKPIIDLAKRFGNKRNTVEAITYYDTINVPTWPGAVIDANTDIALIGGAGYARRVHILTGPGTPEEPDPEIPPPPPITVATDAQFTSTAVKGVAPFSVTFTSTATATPPVNAWGWDFTNNGSIDLTTQVAERTYVNPGIYTVRHTASNGVTSDEIIKTSYVEVLSAPPKPTDPTDPGTPVTPSLLHPTQGKWYLQIRGEWPFNSTWYGPNIATPSGVVGNDCRAQTESAFNNGALWNQDINQWTGNISVFQNGTKQPISRVADPTGLNRTVFKFTVDKLTSTGASNESNSERFRAELQQQGFSKRPFWGEERWEGYALLVPTNMNSLSPGDYMIVYQYHADISASVTNPPFSLEIQGGPSGTAQLFFSLLKSGYPSSPGTRILAASHTITGIPVNTWIYIVTNHRCGYNPAQTPKPFFKAWYAFGETDTLTNAIDYYDGSSYAGPGADTGAWSFPDDNNTGQGHYTKNGIYYPRAGALWSGSGSLATSRTVYTQGISIIRPGDVPGISKEQMLSSLRGQAAPITPPPPPPPTGVWTEIAKEWGNFTITNGPKTVRFGTGSSWIEKSSTNGVHGCHDVYFGSDPAVGQAKVCQVYNLDISTPPPPPPAVANNRTPPSWADWSAVPILSEMGTLRAQTSTISIYNQPAQQRIIENLDFNVPNGCGIIIGHGVDNVLIRNCRFRGCGVDTQDINVAAITIGGQSTANILRIENCYFEDNCLDIVWNGDLFKPTNIAGGQCRRAIWVRGNNFVRQRVSYWGGTVHPRVPTVASGGWIKGQKVNLTRGIGHVPGLGVTRVAGNLMDDWFDPNTVGNLTTRYNYIPPTVLNYWGGPMHAGPYRRGSTDHIAIFECSGGPSGNYLDIDSNVIRGGGYFDGTGVLIGDAVNRTTQYVRARRNRIYRPVNNGIQIGGGYGHVVTGNFIDSYGEDINSLTHFSVSVRKYEGKENPGGHTVTNNRTRARLWNYKNNGVYAPGVSIDATIPNVTQSGNVTADQTLGEHIFNDPWGSWSV